MILTLTVTSFIRENVWEYGVLRSLGITQKQIFRICIYEMMSVVISSTLSGLFVGGITSVSFVAQLSLFAEMPFSFSFPLDFFLFTFVMTSLTSLVGTSISCSATAFGPIAPTLKLNG